MQAIRYTTNSRQEIEANEIHFTPSQVAYFEVIGYDEGETAEDLTILLTQKYTGEKIILAYTEKIYSYLKSYFSQYGP